MSLRSEVVFKRWYNPHIPVLLFFFLEKVKYILKRKKKNYKITKGIPLEIQETKAKALKIQLSDESKKKNGLKAQNKNHKKGLDRNNRNGK